MCWPGCSGEHLSGAAAVDRDRDVAVRVFVQDDLAGPSVGERSRGGGVVTLAGGLELEPRPRHDARALEILAGQVQLHVPEAVDEEHGCVDDAVVERRLRQLEPHERVRRERRSELRGLDAECEVRRRGREQVARVERPRHGLERVRGIRDLVRALDPGASAAGTSSPLSGPTNNLPPGRAR